MFVFEILSICVHILYFMFLEYLYLSTLLLQNNYNLLPLFIALGT